MIPFNFQLSGNNSSYYMARQILAFWLVLSWSGFRHMDRFRGNGHKPCTFCFRKPPKFKTSMARVPYNKLLTNLASSSRTGEYWPSVVFCTDLAALGPYCHDLILVPRASVSFGHVVGEMEGSSNYRMSVIYWHPVIAANACAFSPN